MNRMLGVAARIGAGVLLLGPPAARAQRPALSGPRIGCAYPAGGRRGATFEVLVSGQSLAGVTNAFVSGAGVTAEVVAYERPLTQREVEALREELGRLVEKMKANRGFRGGPPASPAAVPAAKPPAAGSTNAAAAAATGPWTAADEARMAELRTKVATFMRRPPNPAIAETATVRVTVAAEAAAGARELRLGTPQGLTNPLRFEVDEWPEFVEAVKPPSEERRGDRERPDGRRGPAPPPKPADPLVELPVVVNGRILPGETDRYRFEARRGMRLVIAAAARELIPYLADAVPGWFQATLTLCDAEGHEVAYADDFRFDPDPVLYYEVPADGEYAIEIRDSIYRGREDFVYRLAIGERPFITGVFPLGGRAGETTAVELSGWNLPTNRVAFDGRLAMPGLHSIAVGSGAGFSRDAPFAVDDLPETFEKEPNSQHRTAQAAKPPVVVNGRIERAGDRDYFRFDGRAGETVVAEVYARRLGSPLDSQLKLTDRSGKILAFNDDFEDPGEGLETHHADSLLRATLPADGTYYVQVEDRAGQGGPEYAYRLRLGAPRPDFALRVVPSGINLRPGETVPVTIHAIRYDGFTNAIALALRDAPPGFALGGGAIPAGEDRVRVTVTAPPVKGGVYRLRIEGRASADGLDLVRAATPAEDLMQAFFYRHLVPYRELCACVVARGRVPYGLKIAGELPVRLPAGGTARVRLEMPTLGMPQALELELNDPPEGIVLRNVTFAAGRAEIEFGADAEKLKPGRSGNLIVTAFGSRPADPGGDAARNRPRFPLTTLPAIPYTVVPPPEKQAAGGQVP